MSSHSTGGSHGTPTPTPAQNNKKTGIGLFAILFFTLLIVGILYYLLDIKDLLPKQQVASGPGVAVKTDTTNVNGPVRITHVVDSSFEMSIGPEYRKLILIPGIKADFDSDQDYKIKNSIDSVFFAQAHNDIKMGVKSVDTTTTNLALQIATTTGKPATVTVYLTKIKNKNK